MFVPLERKLEIARVEFQNIDLWLYGMTAIYCSWQTVQHWATADRTRDGCLTQSDSLPRNCD